MAGILTPVSTGGDAPAHQPRPAAPAPTPAQAPLNTLSMNSPLAGSTVQPGNTPPLHSDEAVNMALMNAFRPVIPDQINSLLGPAIGHIQGGVLPIAYYQPRPAAQIATKRSS